MLLGYGFSHGHQSKIFPGKSELNEIVEEGKGGEVEDWTSHIVEICAVVLGCPVANTVWNLYSLQVHRPKNLDECVWIHVMLNLVKYRNLITNVYVDP